MLIVRTEPSIIRQLRKDRSDNRFNFCAETFTDGGEYLFAYGASPSQAKLNLQRAYRDAHKGEPLWHFVDRLYETLESSIESYEDNRPIRIRANSSSLQFAWVLSVLTDLPVDLFSTDEFIEGGQRLIIGTDGVSCFIDGKVWQEAIGDTVELRYDVVVEKVDTNDLPALLDGLNSVLI